MLARLVGSTIQFQIQFFVLALSSQPRSTIGHQEKPNLLLGIIRKLPWAYWIYAELNKC